jgi:hypothetical protein
VALGISCGGECGDFGPCRGDQLAVGVGVAMQAPPTVRCLGEQHPCAVGNTRIPRRLANEPGEFRDHRELLVPVQSAGVGEHLHPDVRAAAVHVGQNDTRTAMIEGAIELLSTRGVHAASLLKVLEHTGAPRGSVYHHFPGGKEELILAALDLTGQRHDRFADRFRGTSAEEITAGYLELWRRILVRSRLESGCPILAVTVSVSAGPLLDRAGEIFRTSQRHLVNLY